MNFLWYVRPHKRVKIKIFTLRCLADLFVRARPLKVHITRMHFLILSCDIIYVHAHFFFAFSDHDSRFFDSFITVSTFNLDRNSFSRLFTSSHDKYISQCEWKSPHKFYRVSYSEGKKCSTLFVKLRVIMCALSSYLDSWSGCIIFSCMQSDNTRSSQAYKMKHSPNIKYYSCYPVKCSDLI